MPLSLLRVFSCILLLTSVVTSSVWCQVNQTEIESWPKYATVKLEADLSHLSANQKKMIPLLIEAGEEMDKAFWRQAYGNRSDLRVPVGSKKVNAAVRRHLEINYGPWERLRENKPFIDGVGEKPAGANFYPADMTKEDFEKQVDSNPELKSLYTMVRWTEDGDGGLMAYGCRGKTKSGCGTG